MAGSERSGPLAASAALFDGRPWAITPHVHSTPEAVDLVEALARLCGAEPVRLSPVEHDRAVARTSHLPHLLAVLTAGQLAEAQPEHLSLSGQGVRDVTRIAGGDPDMWSQIIRANQAAVSEILRDVQADLERLIEVLASEDEETLEEILTRGVTGTRAIPGKHGGPALATASVFVSVPDHPGELARLFADVGEIGVNIEDLHIDHDPGRPVGLVELVVEDTAAECAAGRSRDQGMGHPPVGLARCWRSRDSRSSSVEHRRADQQASSSPWTDLPDRASRARRAGSRRGSACATSTPAPSSVRSPPGCSTTRSTSPTRPPSRRAPASPRSCPAPTRRTPRSPSTAATSPSRSAPQDVTDHVSAVASVPEVRQRLLDLQRVDHRRGRDRRRGTRHRLGGGPGRGGEALPHR